MNRSSSRPLIVTTLLVVSGILVAVSLGSQGQTTQGPISFILSPLQNAFGAVARSINDSFRGPVELQTLRARNQQLEQQMSALNAEVSRLREYQMQAEQYREMLKFSTDNPAIVSVGADVTGPENIGCNVPVRVRPRTLITCANVIGSDTNPYLRYVTINAGRVNGVRSGMPVVAGGMTLVGRVATVSDASATVQLLNDARSFVNVVIQGARVSGTITGREDGELVLQNVQQTDSIGVGDGILTSGLGGSIPSGLVIGQIEQMTSVDAQLFKEARVRPAADYTRLGLLQVITSTSAPALLPAFPAEVINPAPEPTFWQRLFGR